LDTDRGSFGGKKIIVLEDEFLLANQIAQVLTKAGANVLGPVKSVSAALQLLASEPDISGAVIDLNLSGELAFRVADRLMAAAVPVVIVTGYERWAVPERFWSWPMYEKPVAPVQVVQALLESIYQYN